MLRLHRTQLLMLFGIVNGCLIILLSIGEVKPWGAIDFFDVLAEGGISIVILAWVLFMLNSRPTGAVTHWLNLGLSCLFLGTFLDAVDEIIALPTGHWAGNLESLFMPVGLAVLTLGLYHWHREQHVLSVREHKREQGYREYRWQDPLTGLGDARYLRQQLQLMGQATQQHEQPLALLLLDIDYFDRTHRLYGSRECDRLLKEMSELLLLNLRRCDLLCRYAGDRFAIVLPNTGSLMARDQAQQLNNAVRHFAYKTTHGETLFHTASFGLALAPPEHIDKLLESATQALLQTKEAQAPRRAA